MKPHYYILLIILLSIGCNTNQNAKKPVQTQETAPQEITKEGDFTSLKSFAVVWNWTKGRTIDEVLPEIQQQVPVIIDLWKKGVVENAYIQHDSKLSATETFPNVFFIIKGKSEREVRGILDKTPAFASGVTRYELHPIGVKWLKRNENAVKKHPKAKMFLLLCGRQLHMQKTLIKRLRHKTTKYWICGMMVL